MSVVEFPEITPNNAVSLLRTAVNAGRVSWTLHAKERMVERDISTRQVLECLKQGQADGLPELDVRGNYCCRVKRRVAGVTITTVAALTKRPDGALAVIITAFQNH